MITTPANNAHVYLNRCIVSCLLIWKIDLTKILFFVYKDRLQCRISQTPLLLVIEDKTTSNANRTNTWIEDQASLLLRYTKVCRSCLQEAHKNCCQNYDKANRSTCRVIKHIMCVDKLVDEDAEDTSGWTADETCYIRLLWND